MAESFIPRITLSDRKDALLILETLATSIAQQHEYLAGQYSAGKKRSVDEYARFNRSYALFNEACKEYDRLANEEDARLKAEREVQAYYDRVMPGVPNVGSALEDYVMAVAESLDPTINKD